MKSSMDRIDENDLLYVIERFGNPITSQSAPVTRFENGEYKGQIKINPHISRFFFADGDVVDVFHIKPVYYQHIDGSWRPLSEVASYYGTRRIDLREDWDKHIDLNYLAWLLKYMKLMGGNVSIPSPFVPKQHTPISLEKSLGAMQIHFATLTFYPDPSPAVTACDGTTEAQQSTRTFTFQRADTGGSNVSYSISPLGGGDQGNNACVNNWGGGDNECSIQRGIFMFDTSTIGSGTTITAATMSLFGSAHNNASSTYICIVTTTPANNTFLVNADYAQFGSTKQATDLSLSTWSDVAYNDFIFNATGYGNISKTGVSKYGTRIGRDFDNSSLGASNLFNGITVIGANNTGTTQDPKLVVTTSSTSYTSTLTESITVSGTLIRASQRTFSQAITLTDIFAGSFIKAKTLVESITLTALFSFKLNGTNVVWTHIAKSTAATWTKVARSAASVWTHTNKSNQ